VRAIRITVFIVAIAVLLGCAPMAFPASDTGDAQQLLKMGRADDAISKLKQELAEKHDDAMTHHLLSRAYYALGQYDRAVKEGEIAVHLSPNNSEFHLWLGRAYGAKAEHASIFSAPGLARKVKEHFEKAVELNGNSVDARLDLAEFYMEAPGLVGGGKDKARAQADELSRRDAAAAYWVKARLAEKDENYTLAEEQYKEAIKASGNRAEHWLNLASFYRRRGRLNDMEDAISKAVSAQRRDGNVLVDAASLLLRAGRSLPEAAELLTKYLANEKPVEQAPAFKAHYLLGQILEKQGDAAGAAKEYQAALDLASDYESARVALNRVQGK